MSILGIVLLIGAVGLCGYMVFTLVRDVRAKIKENKLKGDKKE